VLLWYHRWTAANKAAMQLTALRKSTQNIQYLRNSIGVVPSLLSVLVTQQKLVWSLLTYSLVCTPTQGLDATPAKAPPVVEWMRGRIWYRRRYSYSAHPGRVPLLLK